MKNPKRGTRNPTPKMNAAARVAAWRSGKNDDDAKGYRPNPRRTLSDGKAWRQKP